MFTKLNSISLAIFLVFTTGSMHAISQIHPPKIITSSAKLNLRDDAERIAKSNPEVAKLRFARITDFESDCLGLGYGSRWFMDSFDYGLLDIDIFTLGKNNIGDSIDEGVQDVLNRQVDDIRRGEKEGVYRSLTMGTAYSRNIGGRRFLYLPMTYSRSVRGGNSDPSSEITRADKHKVVAPESIKTF